MVALTTCGREDNFPSYKLFPILGFLCKSMTITLLLPLQCKIAYYIFDHAMNGVISRIGVSILLTVLVKAEVWLTICKSIHTLPMTCNLLTLLHSGILAL